jgi:5,10-methylenetetrahydromethanopterin reductase
MFGDITSQQMVRFAKEIEGLRYDHIWVPDERFNRDAFVTLTSIALATDTIKLGVSVTDPYIRHPTITATLLATLDEVASGRAILGIGAGISGFRELGISRQKPAVAIREAVEVIRKMLLGEAAELRGKVVSVTGAKLGFKPFRNKIPIYIAGRGPKILQVAGEIGDGAIIGGFASSRTLAYALKQIHTGLERSGRSYDEIDVVSWVYIAIAEDGEEAKNLVRPIVAYALLASRDILEQIGISPQSVSSILDELQTIPTTEIISAKGERIARKLPAEIVDDFSLAGRPEEIVTKIRVLEKVGVKNLALLPFPPKGKGIDYIYKEFAQTVMPLFR